MGAHGSARAVGFFGGNLVCAHAGDAMRRIANISFFIRFSRKTCAYWPLFNRIVQKKSTNRIVSSGKQFSPLACRIFSPKDLLTKKLARRLVIGEPVIIVMANRYLHHKR
jgi:hypothetical protein